MTGRAPNVDRVKRQLLRELVDDNVSLIRGEPVRPPRRRRSGRRRAWLTALVLLALAPLALSVSSWTADPSTGPGRALPATASGPGRPGVTVPGEHLPLPLIEEVPTPALDEPRPASFPAPTPLDPDALPLAVRKIVLDPGHGGSRPGARAPMGVVEKEVSLDLAERLAELLEEAGFEVLLTREEDVGMPLVERARRANEAGGDIFVSIHLNWIVNRQVRGVETYYLGSTDDPYLTALAASENRGSGLSLSELRPLLDEIYLDVRNENSRKLAESVQRALFRSLARINPALEDRGVKTAPFIVLAKTEMPAILAEVSCLSNRREAELLTKPLYRQYIAEALFTGLRAYAESLDAQEG